MPTRDELAALEAERRRKYPAAAALVFDTERDDPDAVARDVRIARELSQASGYRVPRSLVSQYRDDFRQLSDLERARKILAASPKLAEWGIDPDNAALSKDDLERLARIERLAGDGWIEQPTAENVNADPKTRMSTSEVVLGHAKEFGKGAAKGVASDIVGKSFEGTGQLLAGLSDHLTYPTTEGHDDLARRVSRARYVPQAEVEAINRDIDKLAAVHGVAGPWEDVRNAHIQLIRQTLSDVLDGRKQPKEAFDLIQPLFGGLSKVVVETTAGKRAGLAKRIAESITASKRELAAIERDIDLLIGNGNQAYATTSFGQAENTQAAFARYVLGEVRAGRMSSDKASKALAPMLAPALETAGKVLQSTGEEIQTRSEKMLEPAKGFEDSIFREMGEATGAAAGIMAATAVNPYFGASVAVAAGVGEGVSEAREADASERIQTQSGLVNGGWALLTALPFERFLFNPATARKGWLAIAERVGKTSIAEGVRSASQETVKNVNAIGSYDPSRSWYSGVLGSFLSGAIVGGAFDVGGGAYRAVIGKDAPAPTAEQKQGAVNTVLDESAGSMTRERAPESFESFSTSAFKDGPIENVHLRAAILDEQFRSQKIDPLTVIGVLPGVSRTDFATAMATGGDLRIPTASYAARIAGSDADAVLRPHLRVDPAGSAPAAPDAPPQPQDDAGRAAAQKVHDGTIIELGVAGYSPEAAASEALLRSTLYKTMAARAGTSPMPLSIPASPDALLQSDIPVLSSDGLMNSTSPLALDGRDKAAPPDVLPETMNDVQKRVNPERRYGSNWSENDWEN